MALKKSEHEVLDKYNHLFLALGIVLLVFGIPLIIFPVIGTVALELVLGVSLLVVGVVGIITGSISIKWRGSFFVIINGLISVIFGSLLLYYPIAGIIAITFFIGIMMLGQGIFEMIKSRHVHFKFWKRTTLINGIFSALLGFLILIKWPSDSVWVVGLLLGITLIFSGFSAIGFSRAIRKIAK